MLCVTYVSTGQTIPFGNFTDNPRLIECLQECLRKDKETLCLYLEDVVVVFKPSLDDEVNIAALDRFDAVAAAKSTSLNMAMLLVSLAIDCDLPYEDAEEFFVDFPVRFIP